jgi:hypothetical protein
VRNWDSTWIIASDVAPLFANFERGQATGQSSSPRKTLAVQETMLSLVDGDLARIIPGHEPAIYEESDIVELTDPRAVAPPPVTVDPLASSLSRGGAGK